MKKILIAFIGGLTFGFMDNVMRNQSGELVIITGRGIFSTLLVSGGFVGAQVSNGETIKNAILKCNSIALAFFIAYFIGGIFSRLLF